ncbi:retrovirus-related Pol polyprotein from transposon 17.6 [Trichonephila clavipes]|nr:retrovirus-related Pol polyprotein from transposon 17.6 [Trichonephila clavipes]
MGIYRFYYGQTYHEVPNATTGTPTFLLMYGRDPKGTLSILKSIGTGNTLLPLNIKGSVESYLIKLKEKLEVATHKAKLTSDVQQGSYAKYYNRQKKHREFAPGDQVLRKFCEGKKSSHFNVFKVFSLIES